MNQETELNNSKWISIIIFLILDLLQIAFVSILVLDEAVPQIVSLDFSQSNPLISISLFVGICLSQFVLIYYMTLSMLRSPDMMELYPNFDSTRE